MAKKTVNRNDPSLAVVYIRVSTDAQKLGPEAQLDSCRQYAATHGMTVVDVFQDIGVGGATEMLSCPALVQAMDSLKFRGAGTLLIAKRDRLGRDVCKVGLITNRIEAIGARILSADGLPEDDSPASVMIRQIMDVLSQFERAQISERTAAALRVKKNKGECVGRTPLGHKRVGKRIVVDEPKMAHLRSVQQQARDLYQDGQSLQDICNLFKEQKVVFEEYDWGYTMQIHRVLNHPLADLSVSSEL